MSQTINQWWHITYVYICCTINNKKMGNCTAYRVATAIAVKTFCLIRRTCNALISECDLRQFSRIAFLVGLMPELRARWSGGPMNILENSLAVYGRRAARHQTSCPIPGNVYFLNVLRMLPVPKKHPFVPSSVSMTLEHNFSFLLRNILCRINNLSKVHIC